MPTIKNVKVKRTIFTKLKKNPDSVKIYIDGCKATGSSAALYSNPAITTSFYTAGVTASNNINTAKTEYSKSPTKGNRDTWLTKGQEGIDWLNSYSDKVEVIANDDANRDTREEAAANIGLSYLTSQKLKADNKGIPAQPLLAAENAGTGNIKVQVLNGTDYKPSQTTFIAIESSSIATISLDGPVLKIEFSSGGSVKTVAANGKGRYILFTGLKPGADYDVYAYAQNGKKQIGKLSAKAVAKA